MNSAGNLVILKRNPTEHYNSWYLKQWYILQYNPKTLEEFYQAECFSNIYLNEIARGMSYNVPNKSSILEHIESNLV